MAARALAQERFTPARVAELVVSSERSAPAGSKSWIVRAWSSDHRLLLMRVLLERDETVRTEILSLAPQAESVPEPEPLR